VLFSAGFMASLAWAGHGGANTGGAGLIQITADALHLVAAGAWIGGLVPFALAIACALRLRSAAWNAITADVTRPVGNPLWSWEQTWWGRGPRETK